MFIDDVRGKTCAYTPTLEPSPDRRASLVNRVLFYGAMGMMTDHVMMMRYGLMTIYPTVQLARCLWPQ